MAPVAVQGRYLRLTHVYINSHYDNSTPITAVVSALGYKILHVEPQIEPDRTGTCLDGRIDRKRLRSSQTARGLVSMAGLIESDTAVFYCRNARAQHYLHLIFVAVSVDSGCSFDFPLEVLGAGGSGRYTDMQQGVSIVWLVSKGLTA